MLKKVVETILNLQNKGIKNILGYENIDVTKYKNEAAKKHVLSVINLSSENNVTAFMNHIKLIQEDASRLVFKPIMYTNPNEYKCLSDYNSFKSKLVTTPFITRLMILNKINKHDIINLIKDLLLTVNAYTEKHYEYKAKYVSVVNEAVSNHLNILCSIDDNTNKFDDLVMLDYYINLINAMLYPKMQKGKMIHLASPEIIDNEDLAIVTSSYNYNPASIISKFTAANTSDMHIIDKNFIKDIRTDFINEIKTLNCSKLLSLDFNLQNHYIQFAELYQRLNFTNLLYECNTYLIPGVGVNKDGLKYTKFYALMMFPFIEPFSPNAADGSPARYTVNKALLTCLNDKIKSKSELFNIFSKINMLDCRNHIISKRLNTAYKDRTDLCNSIISNINTVVKDIDNNKAYEVSNNSVKTTKIDDYKVIRYDLDDKDVSYLKQLHIDISNQIQDVEDVLKPKYNILAKRNTELSKSFLSEYNSVKNKIENALSDGYVEDRYIVNGNGRYYASSEGNAQSLKLARSLFNDSLHVDFNCSNIKFDAIIFEEIRHIVSRDLTNILSIAENYNEEKTNKWMKNPKRDINNIAKVTFDIKALTDFKDLIDTLDCDELHSAIKDNNSKKESRIEAAKLLIRSSELMNCIDYSNDRDGEIDHDKVKNVIFREYTEEEKTKIPNALIIIKKLQSVINRTPVDIVSIEKQLCRLSYKVKQSENAINRSDLNQINELSLRVLENPESILFLKLMDMFELGRVIALHTIHIEVISTFMQFHNGSDVGLGGQVKCAKIRNIRDYNIPAIIFNDTKRNTRSGISYLAELSTKLESIYKHMLIDFLASEGMLIQADTHDGFICSNPKHLSAEEAAKFINESINKSFLNHAKATVDVKLIDASQHLKEHTSKILKDISDIDDYKEYLRCGKVARADDINLEGVKKMKELMTSVRSKYLVSRHVQGCLALREAYKIVNNSAQLKSMRLDMSYGVDVYGVFNRLFEDQTIEQIVNEYRINGRRDVAIEEAIERIAEVDKKTYDMYNTCSNRISRLSKNRNIFDSENVRTSDMRKIMEFINPFATKLYADTLISQTEYNSVSNKFTFNIKVARKIFDMLPPIIKVITGGKGEKVVYIADNIRKQRLAAKYLFGVDSRVDSMTDSEVNNLVKLGTTYESKYVRDNCIYYKQNELNMLHTHIIDLISYKENPEDYINRIENATSLSDFMIAKYDNYQEIIMRKLCKNPFLHNTRSC